MTPLPPLLQAFFIDRLARQRDASSHTIASYRDAFKLLLAFLHTRTGKQPSKLVLEDLDAAAIAAFLTHLEDERGSSIRTRNARLVAIHSFFHFAAFKAPQCAEQIARVLAIPQKRHTSTLVSYLIEPEIDALLAAPDRSTWTGRRDHAIFRTAFGALPATAPFRDGASTYRPLAPRSRKNDARKKRTTGNEWMQASLDGGTQAGR